MNPTDAPRTRTDSAWLEAHWMPFTGNRNFKATPRMIVSATVGSWTKLSEVEMAQALWKDLPNRSLAIVDRGFFSSAILAPLAAGRRIRGFVPAMRALRWVTRWSMVEVFMFGTLVAIVKTAGLASVVPGIGVFSYAALMLLLAAIHVAGLHDLWRRASELPS